MPNWTQNYVTFKGSKEKIIELKELFASEEKVFDFNKILPMPEDSEDFQATGDLTMDTDQGDLSMKEFIEKKIETANNWYYWSVKNWGTKWNAIEPTLDVDNECELKYSFRTAWDAPRGVIQEIYDKRDKIIKGLTYGKWTCFHEFEEDEDIILEFKLKDEYQ